MFLNKNSIIADGNNIIFTNSFARNEYLELINNIMENMLNDLSQITGLEKQDILEDYVSLNQYSPIREILKTEGLYQKEKSLVLLILNK